MHLNGNLGDASNFDRKRFPKQGESNVIIIIHDLLLYSVQLFDFC